MHYESRYRIIFCIFFFAVSHPLFLQAQDTLETNRIRPNLFLDCSRCYQTYLKDNINIVNFVRNKDVAQIHLLVNRERTGSGVEWTLKFVGNEEFMNIDNTVSFFSPEVDTEQEERTEFVRNVKLGLLPFITRTPLTQYIGVDYADIVEGSVTRSVEDPWNHWVVEIGTDASLSGEEKQSSIELGGDLNISRVTLDWKIDIGVDIDYERNHFELDSSETITVIRNSKAINALVVKSISPHWSVGGEAFISASSFNNIALKTGISPAIEFNFFPYKDYSHHIFNFLYILSPTYVQYNDSTIYNKTEQFLIEQNLYINYELTEVWGSIEATLNGSTYLHDLSKNRIDFRTRLNFSIYKGLSVFLFGNYSLINNQISLAKGGVTDRQALLRLRERATGYEFEIGFGLNFTFGSIYSNVVNTRFESRQFR